MFLEIHQWGHLACMWFCRSVFTHTLNFFWILFVRFVARDQYNGQCWAPLLRQDSCKYRTQGLANRRFSSLAPFLAPRECCASFPPNRWAVPFPDFGSFTTHMQWLFCRICRDTLQISGVVPLFRSHLPGILFRELELPSFPWSLTCSLLGTPSALPDCTPPCTNPLRAVSAGVAALTPFAFHLPGITTFAAWCLVSWKPLLHICCLSCCHYCFRWEGNLVLVIPSWPEAEISNWLLNLGEIMPCLPGTSAVWLCRLHSIRENIQGEEWRQSS